MVYSIYLHTCTNKSYLELFFNHLIGNKKSEPRTLQETPVVDFEDTEVNCDKQIFYDCLDLNSRELF
jgi:hypothetical protein